MKWIYSAAFRRRAVTFVGIIERNGKAHDIVFVYFNAVNLAPILSALHHCKMLLLHSRDIHSSAELLMYLVQRLFRYFPCVLLSFFVTCIYPVNCIQVMRLFAFYIVRIYIIFAVLLLHITLLHDEAERKREKRETSLASGWTWIAKCYIISKNSLDLFFQRTLN